MDAISAETTLEELAAIVSQALESAGISAVLSGGAAVSIYSENEYLSYDLDFVSSSRLGDINAALSPLGFTRTVGARQFEHPDTHWFVEFPPGPLAFGEMYINDGDALTLDTNFGPLRVISPTQSMMDRLTAYVHWKDLQARDQAVMIAKHQQVGWQELNRWAEHEGLSAIELERLKQAAEDWPVARPTRRAEVQSLSPAITESADPELICTASGSGCARTGRPTCYRCAW